MINYLGGYLEQCRYVNPFMPTGVFYPFKLTDRPVIIGCNSSDIKLLQKLLYLYHLSKQCRQFSDIISFTICLASTWDLHCLSNHFWVLGIFGLTDCVQIMSKCRFCLR